MRRWHEAATRRLLHALAALCLLLAGGAVPAQSPAPGGHARVPQPAIEPATRGQSCVVDTATIRRDHPDLMKHQRDDTVRGGIRGARFSLKDCVDCHAGASSGSVAQAPTDFCVACHSYAAVKIDCFECHSSRPRSTASALLSRRSAPWHQAAATTADPARREAPR